MAFRRVVLVMGDMQPVVETNSATDKKTLFGRRGQHRPVSRPVVAENMPEVVWSSELMVGRVSEVGEKVKHASVKKPCAFSRPGMCLPVNFLKSFDSHLGVYLGGDQAGVAEHLLHAAQVGTGIKQMRGKRMA